MLHEGQDVNEQGGGEVEPPLLPHEAALDGQPETAPPFYVYSEEVFLHVKLAGDPAAKPVLLLHGTALTHECFEETVPEISDDHFVITPDVRGHGDSEWHPENLYTHEACVSDVGAVLDALQITEPVTLVGHSISGLHLARFAAENPELVKEVILVDLLPETNDDVLRPIFTFIQREFDSLEDAVDAVKGFAVTKTEEEIAVALLKVMTHDEDRGVFRYKSDPAFVQEFYGSDLLAFWHDLKALACPLTLIRGALSRVIPEETLEKFASELPEAEIIVIDNASHNPMTDNPIAFAEALKRCLKAGEE